MKKMQGIIIIVVMVVIAVSCVTTNSSNQKQGTPSVNPNLLTPTDIFNKRLTGTDNTGTYTFVFKEDGSLEYTLNNLTYTGIWFFDGTSQIMKYRIEWNEDGVKKGYGVDIIRRQNDILLHGYWYMTDAMIAFSKLLTIEE